MKRRLSFDASPRELWMRLKGPARSYRKEPTPAEAALWKALRKGQLKGYRFRRQLAIGQFLVDFCCWQHRLVIEVDGEIHRSRALEDAERQKFIENSGFQVLRFTNDEISVNIEGVLGRILEKLESKNDL